MGAFKDWADLDKGAALPLPISGTVYTVPSPPAGVGLRVQAFMQELLAAQAQAIKDNGEIDFDQEVLDDAAELDLYRDVLGTALEAMEADGVPIEAVKHAALTAIVWVAFDEAAAKRVWEGKALAAPASNPQGVASSTPKPGSGSTTTSPNRKRRRRRPAGGGQGGPSHGPTSSGTGR
ncbi:hypothetical protein LO763_22845 [Glycomyces sp. A-F 0318]|uniref:DUF7426 family protein n=1 Tax=Glycomyces amatae TaxID=2881355 RepID=UPI001E4EC234|nr:hypothetical protein [Glycomyces amatae]MCD0446458.1 hypothetical protein [Glycomyces amatae]